MMILLLLLLNPDANPAVDTVELTPFRLRFRGGNGGAKEETVYNDSHL